MESRVYAVWASLSLACSSGSTLTAEAALKEIADKLATLATDELIEKYLRSLPEAERAKRLMQTRAGK